MNSHFREDAIIELSQRLKLGERIEYTNAFVNVVLEHEAAASAVFDSVAFPVGRGRAVKELSFAAGLSQECIRWGVGPSPVVRTVILLALPL